MQQSLRQFTRCSSAIPSRQQPYFCAPPLNRTVAAAKPHPAPTRSTSSYQPYVHPRLLLRPIQAAHNPDNQQQQKQQQQQQQQQKPLVRPLQPSDKQAWLQLFRDYIAWYKASVSDEVIEMTWQRLMAGGEGNHQGLIAEDSSGQAVGIAHLLLHKSTWSATHYCYLEDLYVQHKVRGAGVGAALIEAVYRSADAQGSTKVYWQTHEGNYRARGLYDKMGRKSAFILYERT